MLLIGVLLISLLTACIPLVAHSVVHRDKADIPHANQFLPILAGFLFCLAWFLPDIHISHATSTFQQHFVGGGMYSALLYIYFKQLFNWHLGIALNLIVLFAWISAFGVANEIFEFALTTMKLAHIATGDTDWDLLANTLGAYFCYFLYFLIRKVAKTDR